MIGLVRVAGKDAPALVQDHVKRLKLRGGKVWETFPRTVVQGLGLHGFELLDNPGRVVVVTVRRRPLSQRRRNIGGSWFRRRLVPFRCQVRLGLRKLLLL